MYHERPHIYLIKIKMFKYLPVYAFQDSVHMPYRNTEYKKLRFISVKKRKQKQSSS